MQDGQGAVRVQQRTGERDAARPVEDRDIAALVSRAQDGDVAAFERLIAAHQHKVYSFAFAFTGDRERAKDIAQEALVKVYRSIHSYRAQSSFSTWLYAIVRNSYLDAVRSRAGKERSLEDELKPETVRDLIEDHSAERALLDEERRRTLWQALRKLPESYRTVVVMFDVQGQGHDEIAAALGIPIGTVKSRLNRGREALREILASAAGTSASATEGDTP